MKNIFKTLAIILGGGLLILLFGAMYINIKGIPNYEIDVPDIKIEKDSQSIANGMKIAALVCNQCHMGEKNGLLEGKRLMDVGEGLGKVWAPNITKHPEKGIGGYSDGELAFLLRTGIKRDGQLAPPWMPRFSEMAEEDLYDLIAFFRSDHPSLQPSEKVQPLSQPNFLLKTLMNIAFAPFPYPEEILKKPNDKDRVALGEYLSNAIYQCYSCHSANFTTNDDYQPTLSEGLFGGGNKMLGPDNKVILSSNITIDQKTGIGNWTEADFIKAVRWGTRPDGTLITFPMNKYTLLSDEEVGAIWAYLQTVPIIKNEIKNSQ